MLLDCPSLVIAALLNTFGPMLMAGLIVTLYIVHDITVLVLKVGVLLLLLLLEITTIANQVLTYCGMDLDTL